MRPHSPLRLVLLCSTALFAQAANAACLEAGIDETCVNSGSLPNGIFDLGVLDLTNTASGSIGPTGIAVQTNGGGSIDNAGSIDANIFGILTYGDLTLTNSGSITGGAIALLGGGTTVDVTNSGTMSGIFGIYSTGHVTLDNSGSMIGAYAVDDSFGVLGETVDIRNSGLISGGFDGIGINDSGVVQNSGTIEGTGIGAGYFGFGIMSRGDLDLVNTGIIRGEYGVSVSGSDAGTVIDNDGWIIGTNGAAIDLSGASVSGPPDLSSGNRLILRGWSRIDGAVVLGLRDEVQVETGAGISRVVTLTSVLNQQNGPQIPAYLVTALGGGVLVRDGDTLATYDTGAIQGGAEGLAGLSQAVSGALAGGAFAEGLPAAGGATVSSSGASAGGRGWATGFGGASHDQGDALALARDQSLGGIVAGYTLPTAGNLSLGVMAGAARGSVDVTGSQTLDTDYSLFGVYGAIEGETWLRGALTAGQTASDSRRMVADNTAPGGIAYGSGSFDGSFVALALQAGRDIAGANGAVWTPSVGLDYVSGSFDGYAETGSADALTLDARDARAMALRAGVARRQSVETGAGTLDTMVSAGLIATRVEGETVAGSLLGQGFETAVAGTTDLGVTLGSGLALHLSPGATLSLSGEAVLRDGSVGGSGALSLVMRF